MLYHQLFASFYFLKKKSVFHKQDFQKKVWAAFKHYWNLAIITIVNIIY